MDSISHVLSSVYTDAALKRAIEVLDSDNLVNKNDRNVRSLAEQRLLSTTSDMLSQMKPLATSLISLQALIAKQKKIYDNMSQVSSKLQSISDVYSAKAQVLEDDRTKLVAQKNTLEAFMERIYISSKERELLSDASSALTEEFLVAFYRVRQIHSESAKVMLADMPSAGELLMLETSKLLDQAYMKVKTAIELEMKKKNTNEGEARVGLRNYMSLLADRPLLFKSVLENQSGTRKKKLTRDFSLFIDNEKVNAAVLPVRFMGNTLAWVHAAIVNELENISLLLDPGNAQVGDAETAQSTKYAHVAQSSQLEELLNTTNPHQIVSELVDQIMSGIEATLRKNLNALTVAQTDSCTVHELQNMLRFYQRSLLARYEQPTIASLLDQIDLGLTRQFQRLLPSEWNDCVELALKLLKCRDTGLLIDDQALVNRLDQVLDSKLDEELKNGDAIMALNTLHTAISRLAGFVIVQPKLEQIKSIENEYVAKLVASELALIKSLSKLDQLQVHALSWREFTISMDKFLINSGQELITRLDALKSPTLAHKVANLIVDKFVDEYEFATKDYKNARPAEEVRSLMA